MKYGGYLVALGCLHKKQDVHSLFRCLWLRVLWLLLSNSIIRTNFALFIRFLGSGNCEDSGRILQVRFDVYLVSALRNES